MNGCLLTSGKGITFGTSVFFLFANLIFTSPLLAETRIAVLDFELKDLTLNPNTPEKIERTASIKAMFKKTLGNRGDYKIIGIDQSAQGKANVATGYLFDHFDVAGELGKEHGAG